MRDPASPRDAVTLVEPAECDVTEFPGGKERL